MMFFDWALPSLESMDTLTKCPMKLFPLILSSSSVRSYDDKRISSQFRAHYTSCLDESHAAEVLFYHGQLV